jgi:hypothetical protein
MYPLHARSDEAIIVCDEQIAARSCGGRQLDRVRGLNAAILSNACVPFPSNLIE